MKLLYILNCLLTVWFAYNLYNPNFANMRLMVPSFIAGWLVGELAFFVIVLQVLLTFFFISAGATAGFLGTIGLLASIASWYYMAKFYLKSGDAKFAFEDALKSSLGPDYFDKIDEKVRMSVPESVDIERLLKPFSLDLPDVERIKNIQYDHQDGINLRLDVYRKRGDSEQNSKKPVLFQIHGGAWTYRLGSKDEQGRPLMNHLASNGWVCVSINYRLSPKATFPEHIIDCKKALTWVKHNIAEYGGDPDFIVATGGSAGGHLSSLLALTANAPEFQPGFEDEDTSVQGCVPFYGVYDFTNANDLHHNKGLEGFLVKNVFKKSIKDNIAEYEAASPMHRIHKDAPPFLVIQGDADTLVSGPEATHFAEELDRISEQPVTFVELEGAQHAFDIFVCLRSEYTKFGIQKFVSYIHQQYLAKA